MRTGLRKSAVFSAIVALPLLLTACGENEEEEAARLEMLKSLTPETVNFSKLDDIDAVKDKLSVLFDCDTKKEICLSVYCGGYLQSVSMQLTHMPPAQLTLLSQRKIQSSSLSAANADKIFQFGKEARTFDDDVLKNKSNGKLQNGLIATNRGLACMNVIAAE